MHERMVIEKKFGVQPATRAEIEYTLPLKYA
jgi:hypothetical protein